MSINKTTQYTINPNSIPVVTSTGEQTLANALDARLGKLQVESVAASTYTPVVSDADNKLKVLSDAVGVDLIIPSNASVPYQTGASLLFQQGGAGQVTIAGASGVTVTAAGDLTHVSSGQGALFQLIKTGTDEWALFGSLATDFTGYRVGPVYRYITTSDWTKPDDIKAIRVRVQAAGGGGGGTASTTGGGQACAAGGGGGEYAEGWFLAADLTATETVTVGAAGAGGVAGNNAGGGGALSSFGSLITAVGGQGGGGSAASSSNLLNAGGLGGSGGTGGDIRIPGGVGGNAQVLSGVRLPNGVGGSSFMGNPVAQLSNNVGSNGNIYGAGGSGATSAGFDVRAGGDGGAGIIIVEEYY